MLISFFFKLKISFKKLKKNLYLLFSRISGIWQISIRYNPNFISDLEQKIIRKQDAFNKERKIERKTIVNHYIVRKIKDFFSRRNVF